MLSRACVRAAIRSTVSSQKRLSSSRYRSIDEFKKHQKEFQFGDDIDNFGSESQHSKLSADFQNSPSLETHPKLQGLKPNSPDYKYQLLLLQQEFQAEKERERTRWEYVERLKGLGAGIGALVGIIATYQLVMNYKYLKTYFRSVWAYDVDVSQVQDMNDPKKNTKTAANLVERLKSETDDAFVSSLQDSKSVPGLYLFGAVSGKKLPARVKGFDGMYLSDVSVSDDYVVAVDDRGKVYHYSKTLGAPVKISMPGKVSKVLSSGGRFFYVASNGKEIYYGDKITTTKNKPTGWFSSAVTYTIGKVALDNFHRSERLSSVVSGTDHLLMLTSQGRLFGMNSAESPENRGQFGVPKYATIDNPEPIPTNVAFELTNMNNEVVTSGNGVKGIKPRTFSAIAATKYANAAIESNGNLWTWGDNSACQCGRTIAVANDTQPVPKMVYSLKDLARISKYSLADSGKKGTFSADGLYAANNTVFLKMTYHSDEDPSLHQELLLSFGDGLRGQLGISRYLHMSHTPLVLKSLVGMKEYDETNNTTHNIGIKNIVGGGDHVFVTLDNAGSHKEVLVFGENLKGQFGNGRTVKSAKPTQLPKLIEPEDFDASTKSLALRVNNQNKNRLQLTDGEMKGVEQVIAAGEQSSAIYYRRK
ncbi:hypothetical protein JCM33374_g2609 [Metschnikowia sp. JCM 33374]|nr:hypothetical protein JCM33374_g2609 [Metschnikowia sp. JCM 33374]